MNDPTGFILGFDPGGNRKFGWCVCHTAVGEFELLSTGLADDAIDALAAVRNAIDSSRQHAHSAVIAAGIDAPMFWSPVGARTVDEYLRNLLKRTDFPTPSGTVQQVNSLWGACLVQGVLLGRHLQETWTDLAITETHPKVLDHLLPYTGHRAVKQLVENLVSGLHDPGRHKRDAILSAVAAWAMVRGLPGWRDLYLDEPNPLQPFNTRVSYWMPYLTE